MATTAIIPLFSQNETATINITEDTTYEIDSRELMINANGGDTAPTYTVDIEGKTGLVVYIDITSLNADSATAAAVVKFRKGDTVLTFDAATEQAIVQLTKEGIADISDLKFFGNLATTTGVFPS